MALQPTSSSPVSTCPARGWVCFADKTVNHLPRPPDGTSIFDKGTAASIRATSDFASGIRQPIQATSGFDNAIAQTIHGTVDFDNAIARWIDAPVGFDRCIPPTIRRLSDFDNPNLPKQLIINSLCASIL
ncbi:hypothetical protein [Flaviaesturariibacter aridisoli]|uniref:Uncharacterized protein n=1 Tax=Flaviaesturariibacter aridisoli TaxID=2545761 RepID=A0A4R4E682_9BACT|nr:hypothetical protein [Flaviaesturariibacter aridisoli]TCZ75009.1 hypothetical protein E0486_01500 [Flaviaesturariibacter aridisoli]